MLLILIINKEIRLESDNQLSILLFINSIILAPFIEELVYRYSFIMLPINNVFRVVLLLASMLIFTYGHAAAASYNVFFLIPFLLMSAILSYIYIKENNIWYSITCHSLYNLIVILLYYRF